MLSENQRISLNIAATYARSLYSLAIGIFCGRWTYLTLGQEDYGLVGVVGGLAAFVGFFNGILAAGVGRFYALSVGLERKDPVAGLEKCREWVATAILLHTLVPIVMVIIGYPIGEWAVRHFLTISPNRVEACVWVWRFTCISCFVSMVTVPYNAMYTAKQEIAELTIYSFVSATANVIFLYYAVNHPGDWLARVSCWACLLSIFPSLIITIRAFIKYQEFKINSSHLRCWSRIIEMLKYCGWITFGVMAWMARDQGVNLVINKYCGATVNAALGVGNTVSKHCTSLTGSMVGAFSPAIMNAYGAGDINRVRILAIRVSKLAVFFILIFALPLGIEIQEILHLWLKNPPRYAAGLCICILAKILIDRSTQGHEIAITAKGRLAAYQISTSTVMMLIFPISWFLMHRGYSVYSIGFAMVTVSAIAAISRVILANLLLDINWRKWIFNIALPFSVVAIISVFCGFIIRLYLQASFMRVCTTTIFVSIPMLGFSWIFVLDKDEKLFIISKIKRIFKHDRRY